MIKLARKLKTALNNPSYVASIAWRRVLSKFSYHFCTLQNGWASPPEAVNIYPTDHCNLKCSMCFERLRKPHSELDMLDWIRIIDQIQKFQPRINLSGGEPFLYSQIKELITYIKKRGLFLSITTNGTLLSEYAEEIVRLRINRIHISIDGPEEIHDRIRGIKGTFNRIMKGLARIKKLKRYSTLPIIRINSMLNFMNPDAMHEVIKTGISVGAETVQFLHPFWVEAQSLATHRQLIKSQCGLDLNYWQGADVSCNKPRDFRKALDVLDNLEKEKRIPVEIFPSFNYGQLKAYYTEKSGFYSIIQDNCQTLWSTATILASGDVESCPDYVLGNCRGEPFLKLWNKNAMKILRHRIKKGELFTVCRACCFLYQ